MTLLRVVKYSGEQVTKAGEKLRRSDIFENESESSAVLEVISYWRSEHDVPLMRAFETLQRVALTKDRRAIFAKRSKRIISIARKLRRFDTMDLKNMQDIGGCRAIITNQKKLVQVLRELKQVPAFRWPDGKYRIKDYIENPKPDGYRSVHIIGRFAGEARIDRKIEVQLRTYIQHYWATALEIVDLFTDQALKSNQGDEEWRVFFEKVGEHFAAMDSIHLFETMGQPARLAAYRQRLRADPCLADSASIVARCAKKLRVREKLEAFAGSLVFVDGELNKSGTSGFVLLQIDIEKKKLVADVFPPGGSKEAEAAYIAVESRTATKEGVVAALVSTTAVGGIKEAYPNYFADSSKFDRLLQLIIEA